MIISFIYFFTTSLYSLITLLFSLNILLYSLSATFSFKAIYYYFYILISFNNKLQS